MPASDIVKSWLSRADEEGVTLFLHEGKLWVGGILDRVSKALLDRFMRDLKADPEAHVAMVAHLSGNVAEVE